MLRIIKLLIILLIAFPVYASAPSIYIPEEALLIVPEEDFVELICLESKWKGGEAMANLEAIEEVLNNSFQELKQFGINLNSSDYLSSDSLESALSSICSAKTIESAFQGVDSFKNQALNLEQSLQNNLALKLRQNVEKAFSNKEEEIKKSFENELDSYSQKLQKEMEERSEELIEIEDSKLRAELEARVESRVIAEVNRQAKNDSNPDSSYYLELGKKLSEQFKAEEDAIHKKELAEISQEIVENEKNRMQGLIDQFIEDNTGKIDQVRDLLENIPFEINSLKEKKEQEWLKYKDQALETKRNIFKKVIDYYFNQAEEIIISKKDLINKAQEQNTELEILTFEEIKEKLNQDKQEILNLLLNGEITQDKINQVKNEFENKWQEIKKEMEKIETQSAEKVIDQIIEHTDWKRLKVMLNENFPNAESIKETYTPLLEKCQNDSNILNPSNKEEAGYCSYCSNENQLRELINYSVQIKIQIEVCLNLIEELEQYQSNKSLVSIDQALSFKNELVSEFEKLRLLQKSYNSFNENYKYNFEISKQECSNYLNK